MKISRRPNSRESRENAPGPRKLIAAAIAITFVIRSLLSKGFDAGVGIHDSAYPKVTKITRALVIGVRIPTKRQAPPERASDAATHVSRLRWRQSFR